MKTESNYYGICLDDIQKIEGLVESIRITLYDGDEITSNNFKSVHEFLKYYDFQTVHVAKEVK